MSRTATRLGDTYSVWRGISSSLPDALLAILVDDFIWGLPDDERAEWKLGAFRVLACYYASAQPHRCALCLRPDGQPGEPNPEEVTSTNEEVFLRHALWSLNVISAGVYLEATENFRLRPPPAVAALKGLAGHYGQQGSSDLPTRPAVLEVLERVQRLLSVPVSEPYLRPSEVLPSQCPRCELDWSRAVGFPYYSWLEPRPRPKSQLVPVPAGGSIPENEQALVTRGIVASWGRIDQYEVVQFLGEVDEYFSLVEHRGKRRKVLSQNVLLLGRPQFREA